MRFLVYMCICSRRFFFFAFLAVSSIFISPPSSITSVPVPRPHSYTPHLLPSSPPHFEPSEIQNNTSLSFLRYSLLRPVPSHQEIYLSATGFTSLILEINERVEDLGSDQEALRYHFDDVVTPGDISHVWETSNVMQLPNFP